MQKETVAEGAPGVPNTLIEERAVSLRAACRLKTSKSLFVLPAKDAGLKSMVIRLESAFLELSTQYYEQAEQHVRMRMESLSETSERIVYIRCLIKMAYFAEVRDYLSQSDKSAKSAPPRIQNGARPIEQYQKAYVQMPSIMVACFLSIVFMVCHLLFGHGRFFL